MARSRDKPSIKKAWRQAQGKRPRGIEKLQQPLRKSTRLQQARQNKYFLPSPPTTSLLKPKALPRLVTLEPGANTLSSPPPEPEVNHRPKLKRKRSQVEDSQGSLGKRPRPETSGSPPPTVVNINGNPLATDVNSNSRRALADTNRDSASLRLQTWLQEASYPPEDFEPGDRTWEDIKADTSAARPKGDEMRDPHLARKKSAASFRQEMSEKSTDAPTENTGDKSLPYRSPGYAAELADQGSYLREAPGGITDKSEMLCQTLLNTKQAVPSESDFHDDYFMEFCDMVRDRNEARVVEDLSPLIAPSPEKLMIYGAKELEHLIFNTNERWSESIAVTKTRPQPDGSVGFKRSAFTENQIQRLLPYIGDRVPIGYVSLFLATWRTFFPFFTREAKGGERDLDVADKQNAHSMTIAVRGIVELFKLVNRERELHREILAFSVSHDASIVKIYGHYALLKDRAAKFYRHPIHSFDFTAKNGKDRWTAYQFTKNVYFKFMPELHGQICSAIDQLPLEKASLRLLSNPPQQILLNDSIRPNTDLESDQPDSQEMTASTPVSQNPLGRKKRRITGNAVLERQLDRKDKELERLRQESDEKLERVRQESDEKLKQLKEEYNRRIKQITQAPWEASVDSEALRLPDEYHERREQREGDGQREQLSQEYRERPVERGLQNGSPFGQRNLKTNSGNDPDFVAMLRQQNAEIQEQMDRQRQESKDQLERQTQEHKREMDVLKDLVRQSISAQPK